MYSSAAHSENTARISFPQFLGFPRITSKHFVDVDYAPVQYSVPGTNLNPRGGIICPIASTTGCWNRRKVAVIGIGVTEQKRIAYRTSLPPGDLILHEWFAGHCQHSNLAIDQYGSDWQLDRACSRRRRLARRRAKDSSHHFLPFSGVPTHVNAQRLVGKSQIRVVVDLGLDPLRDAHSFASQHLPEAIPHSDCVLCQRSNRKIWIDIARCSLQKETDGLIVESLFHGFCHGCRIIRRVLQVFAAKHNGVAGIVHQNRKRFPRRRIHAQYGNSSVHRSSRNLSQVALEPTNASISIHSKSVMTDEGKTIPNADSSLYEARTCFGDRFSNFRESRG